MRAVGVSMASVGFALCAACGAPAAPPPPGQPTPAAPLRLDLDAVGRARDALPAGFEFSAPPKRVSPLALWGFGDPWSVSPPQCAGLVDPAVSPSSVRGWSASGPGTIVYAIAASLPTAPDEETRAACPSFTVAAGHTSGTVAQVPAPDVPSATTLGLRAETATVVEGGTETHSQADTFAAHLGDTVVYVVVRTDPGAADGALGPGFAADLLRRTVSAIRGEAPPGG